MTKAIILAAGQGTRLLPYTKELPKCMIKICGKPLIEFQIDVLRSCGISDINLVVGYESQKLESYGIPTYKNDRFACTNMLYSLFCAKELFEEDGSLIIAYGDIVYSKDILEELLSTSFPISIVADNNWKKYWQARFENVLEDAETFKVNYRNEITEIGSRSQNISDIQSQYIGLIKLSKTGKKTFLDEFTSSSKRRINNQKRENAYMTDFLQELIRRGHQLNAVQVNSSWIEIDSVSDLEKKITQERLNMIISSLDADSCKIK
jgi:choline kinase